MKKLIAGLAAAVLLAAGATASVYLSAAGGSDDGRMVMVRILPGWSASRIAEELQTQGVISSALWFRLFMRIRGGGEELRAGEYELRERMPFGELTLQLRRGPKLKFMRVTIPEGLTVEQTAARVSERTHIAADAFIAAATTSTVRPEIAPPEVISLEGFLYPDTYFLVDREDAGDLVRRMVAEFEKRTGGAPWQEAQGVGITPYQAVIVASMIEEEAKVDDERARISAVIHNRLRRGMPLGIDATIQYAVKRYGQPLTESDLAVDSPYNTRVVTGLPPGPIASPRLSSIVAALQPEATDVLYFVLTEDCKHHFFTADFDQFVRATQRQPRNC